MILPLHILIAVSSIGFTTYMFFNPTESKLKASYVLVAATIASGTALVISDSAHMLQACASGLLYTGISTVTIWATRTKLAVAKTSNRTK